MAPDAAPSVRSLTPDDQPIWRALRLAGLRDTPHAFLTTAAEQEARTADTDRAMLAQGRWRGVFAKDVLAGIAALLPMPQKMAAHRAEVGAVYVAPAYRGAGIAYILMQALENEARSTGILQLELDVASANTRAIRFYEGLGYVRIGLRPRAIWTADGPLDDYTYLKYLDT